MHNDRRKCRLDDAKKFFELFVMALILSVEKMTTPSSVMAASELNMDSTNYAHSPMKPVCFCIRSC